MAKGRRLTEYERQKLFTHIRRGVEFRCREQYDRVELLHWGDKINFQINFNFELDTAMLFDEEKPG